MNDETLEQIQSKIAFLERANADLIRALGARIKEVSERLETAQYDERQIPPEDERPPHY
jgi:uncharacterized coiled-coil protein SlyX